MSKIEIGSINSSNFAIGNHNVVKDNITNHDLALQEEDILAIKEELEWVKSNLRPGTKSYVAVEDVLTATEKNGNNVIQKIKEYSSVFTSNLMINLISSGVYDLIKLVLQQ